MILTSLIPSHECLLDQCCARSRLLFRRVSIVASRLRYSWLCSGRRYCTYTLTVPKQFVIDLLVHFSLICTDASYVSISTLSPSEIGISGEAVSSARLLRDSRAEQLIKLQLKEIDLAAAEGLAVSRRPEKAGRCQNFGSCIHLRLSRTRIKLITNRHFTLL